MRWHDLFDGSSRAGDIGGRTRRLSRNAAARRFGVAVSTAVNWLRRDRETGSAAPGQMGGHKPRKLIGAHRDWLLERTQTDFTLRGLQAELATRGITVDYRTVWSFVHDEGLSFKKSVLPAEQLRPKIARRREQWKKYQGRLDPARLVFIDETRNGRHCRSRQSRRRSVCPKARRRMPRERRPWPRSSAGRCICRTCSRGRRCTLRSSSRSRASARERGCRSGVSCGARPSPIGVPATISSRGSPNASSARRIGGSWLIRVGRRS